MPRKMRTEEDKERSREYVRKWYVSNKEREKERVKKRKQELREWLQEYKSNLSCLRCEETHIACLDFHHRDGSQKEMSISNAINYGWSVERILKEIYKCDVICSNCHRKHHYVV